MRLVPAFLVAMTATASADVEWKWNRVIVDNPQSESARAIAADLDSFRLGTGGKSPTFTTPAQP